MTDISTFMVNIHPKHNREETLLLFMWRQHFKIHFKYWLKLWIYIFYCNRFSTMKDKSLYKSVFITRTASSCYVSYKYLCFMTVCFLRNTLHHKSLKKWTANKKCSLLGAAHLWMLMWLFTWCKYVGDGIRSAKYYYYIHIVFYIII